MSHLQKHDGIFTYANKDIPFSYWSNAEHGAAPDTVLFSGAGQVGKIPYWIAQSAGPGVVVVDGLPHWESDPDKWDIEKFSRDYIQSTYKTVLTKFGLSSMHVLGESQAAPGTVLLANTSPNKIRNLALIRPLGFSVDAYGATPEQRYKNFRRRIFLTQLQIWRRLLIEPRYLQISLLAYRAIRREPSQKAIKDKYTAGVSYDLTHHCRSAANKLHAQGGTLIILIGKDDKIFSAAEILATLRKGNIKYVSTVLLPGGHASLAVRSSKVVLQKALRIVRKGGPV